MRALVKLGLVAKLLALSFSLAHGGDSKVDISPEECPDTVKDEIQFMIQEGASVMQARGIEPLMTRYVCGKIAITDEQLGNLQKYFLERTQVIFKDIRCFDNGVETLEVDTWRVATVICEDDNPSHAVTHLLSTLVVDKADRSAILIGVFGQRPREIMKPLPGVSSPNL